MKNKPHTRHDRSLSLDYNHDSLNSSDLSHQFSHFQSSKKSTTSHNNSKSPLLPHKKTKQIHLQSSYVTRNLFGDLAASSINSSPQKKRHMLSFLNMSQHSSTFKSTNTLQLDSSYKQDSISRAVDNAISNQQEKERNLQESRQLIERDIDSTKSFFHSLENKLITIQKRFNSKQSGIVDRLRELVALVCFYSESGNHQFDDPGTETSLELLTGLEGQLSDREVKELIKNIFHFNQNLWRDLSSIVNSFLHSENLPSADQIDKIVLSCIINQDEEKLKSIDDRKRILIHQKYDAEDRCKQFKETKMMLTEDFHSNVQQLTECVTLQEDLENYVAQLHARNPEFIEKLKKEIRNAEEQIILFYQLKEEEGNLFAKQDVQQEKQLDHYELLKKYDEEQQQYSRYDQMKILILEDIFKREKTLFYYFYKSFHSYRQQYSLQQLFGYLKLFDINLQALQQESQQSVDLLMKYHFLMLEEISEVLKFQRDTENLETAIAQLRQKAKDREEYNMIKSLQNEGLVRRNQLKECNAKIQDQKNQLYSDSQAFPNVQELLNNSVTISFVEVWQEINRNVDNSELIDDMLMNLLTISQQKRENYQAFFDLVKSLGIKQGQLSEWQKQLETQKEELDILQMEIFQQETQISETHKKIEHLQLEQRSIEESYTQISLKERERMYSSYLVDNNDHFKKIKFQFGRNYFTKVQQKVLDDFTNVANMNFSKRKAQFAEIYFTLRGLEKKCESYNHRIIHISNELKQAESSLAEHQRKIESLNQELIDLLKQEKELGNMSGRNSQSRCRFFEKDSEKLFVRLSDNIQEYKMKISQLIHQLVSEVIIFRGKLNKIQDQQEIASEFERLIRDIREINDQELKQITSLHCELKRVQAVIIEKQEKLQALSETLSFHGKKGSITESILKEKTNLMHVFGVMDSSECNIQRNHDKSLNMKAEGYNSITSRAQESRTASNSPFTKENRRRDKLHNTDSKSAFPESLVKPRTRNKSSISHYHSLSQKDLSTSSEINMQQPLSSTDLSSNRSLRRDNSSLLYHPNSARISANLARSTSNYNSQSKSPNRSQLSFRNPSFIMDIQEMNDENTQINYKPATTRKLDLEDILSSQDPKYIEKSIAALEEGIVLFKKFASNNGLALKPAGTDSKGHKRNNSTSKGVVETEPKGYGKRLLKINRVTKTLEIYKAKPGSDRVALEYYYEFKTLSKVFYPAVLGDILRRIRTERNKENQKQMTQPLGENKRQDNLLPFGIDIQNRGRIEFLIGNPEELKQISTCVTYIIKSKST